MQPKLFEPSPPLWSTAIMTTSNDHLEELLAANQLLEAAEKVGDQMFRFRYGSATVIAAIGGDSLVVKAPMFDHLPQANANANALCRHLLSLNVRMSGLASFGVSEDGDISLIAGRAIAGLDPSEFKTILDIIGRFADAFDDLLYDDYYAKEEK